MDIQDLRSGDVLLFSPEKGSWISEAIVLLTGAPVSHAALIPPEQHPRFRSSLRYEKVP